MGPAQAAGKVELTGTPRRAARASSREGRPVCSPEPSGSLAACRPIGRQRGRSLAEAWLPAGSAQQQGFGKQFSLWKGRAHFPLSLIPLTELCYERS